MLARSRAPLCRLHQPCPPALLLVPVLLLAPLAARRRLVAPLALGSLPMPLLVSGCCSRWCPCSLPAPCWCAVPWVVETRCGASARAFTGRRSGLEDQQSPRNVTNASSQPRPHAPYPRFGLPHSPQAQPPGVVSSGTPQPHVGILDAVVSTQELCHVRRSCCCPSASAIPWLP